MTIRELLLPFLAPLGGPATGALDCGRLVTEGQESIAVLWNFGVSGGACGEAEATEFAAAVDAAISADRPLVTVTASGGTKLTEGMAALVGIPRMTIALQRLRAARLPHVSIADSPTTGGVWVAVGCSADIRCGVAGATVAFSGPRVVEAMTGAVVPRGAGTAESAYAAGLLDAVLPDEEVLGWLTSAMQAIGGGTPPGRLSLNGADSTVGATVARISGHRVVHVLLAQEPGAFVTAAGFRLLGRAARLADTIDAPLVVRIDTLGGDPTDADVPRALGEAMRDVLACRSPTLAVVQGAGGSGGALAGAVTDAVVVSEGGWFAALAPAGAAATLRRPVPEVVELMRQQPHQLLEDGFADAIYAEADEPVVIGEALNSLVAIGPAERLARRTRRWSEPLSPRGLS